MLRVYKYVVSLDKDYVSIEMPAGAKILATQAQYNIPQIWALVDPSRETRSYTFRFAETGEDISEEADSLNYVGTFQLNEGTYVGHLFEVIEK